MTREDRLAELLERWEDTRTTGGTATPEELCRDCPDLLADFSRLLARLGTVNALLGGDASAGSHAELTAHVEAGRYKPLSFHAEGGLGVVFVAEDGELRRQVALKCMQQVAALDDNARARFLLEAEITSKLEHPGVVPVYGLGRDGSGRPYYAMRFIHGATLAAAIEGFHRGAAGQDRGERHVELQRLLRRFVSVCETMAYAHARGIVHRDLKPNNILLGSYGETLVVDWGLAKRVERADSGQQEPALEPLRLLLQSDGGQTLLGEVRGSPAFMSPEQARGEWRQVGPASDVYSLGATLYVLLTGAKPYDGRNAREVVEKVKAGACPPPRAVNPAVPQPLDALCRKAMQSEPGVRYAGAAELARDLERWLADEPVSAWREPLMLRARRWLRRHRALATAAALLVLVSTVFLTVTSVLLGQKNRELGGAYHNLDVAYGDLNVKNRALDDKNQELEQRNAELAASYETTRKNFALADRTVRGTLGIINLRQPQGREVADPLRRAVNEAARDYYRGFVERNDGQPGLAFEVAFACLKQGQLMALVGPTSAIVNKGVSEVLLGGQVMALLGPASDPAAAHLLDQARERFRRLGVDTPRARYGSACVDLASARLLIWQLKVTEARPLVARAAEVFDELCVAAPRELRDFDGSADSPAYQLALSCLTLRDLDAATDPHQPGAFPRPGANRTPGKLLPRLRQAATGLRRELERWGETAFECRGLLPLVEICLGEELALDGQDEESLAALRRAHDDLAAFDFPTFYEHEALLVRVDFLLAVALHAKEQPVESERQLLRVGVLLLLNENAYVRLAAVDTLVLLNERAAVARGESERQLLQVSAHARELAQHPRGVDDYGVASRTALLALCSKTLGDWTAEKDRPRAEKYYREALQALAKFNTDSNRTELSLRVQALTLSGAMAEKLIALDLDPKLAREALERARTEAEALTAYVGEVDWVRRVRGVADILLGGLDVLDGKDSLPLLDRGLDRLEKYFRDHPEDRGVRLYLANGHSMRGLCLALVHNQVDEGLREFPVARALLATLDGNDPLATAAKSLDRRVLGLTATIHWSAAEALLKDSKPEAARKALDHAVAGLKILDELEKKEPLNVLEKTPRQQLQILKAQATKRLAEK